MKRFQFEPRSGVILADISTDSTRTWELFVNGRKFQGPVTRVDLVLEDPRKRLHRHLQYAMMGSEGNEYDAIAYYETGGGGTVVVPFIQVEGQVYIGVLIQHRQLMGDEPVKTAAGGYKAPTDASDRQTGERELGEEVTNRPVIIRTFMLEGEPVNPNRAVFITSREGEGVTYFAAEIDPRWVEFGQGGYYHFKPSAAQVNPDVEKALGTVFVPVREAARSACGLVRCGTIALLADLDMI